MPQGAGLEQYGPALQAHMRDDFSVHLLRRGGQAAVVALATAVRMSLAEGKAF